MSGDEVACGSKHDSRERYIPTQREKRHALLFKLRQQPRRAQYTAALRKSLE